MIDVLEELAQAVPKTDLHVHFEGLVTKHKYLEMLRKSSCSRSQEIFDRKFSCLPEFISAIRHSNEVIRTSEDCEVIVRSYMAIARSINIRHVELSVEPAFHLSRGLEARHLFSGILAGLIHAERELGVSSRLIVSMARDLPPAMAFKNLNDAEDTGVHLDAVGLAGDEGSQPLKAFSGFMRYAADRGYRIVAHAGETTSSREIWEAIREFPLSRIDHGCAAVNDPDLITVLRDSRLPLAMAPVSNNVSGASRNGLAAAALLREGVCVSLNSDDPGIQGSTLLSDFKMLIEHQGLSCDEIIQLAVNGFQSSFLEDRAKEEYINKVHLIGARAKRLIGTDDREF